MTMAFDTAICTERATNATSFPEANPDIAGIGVLISFVLPSYFTLFLLAVHYLIQPPPSKANLCDAHFLLLFKRSISGASRKFSVLYRTLSRGLRHVCQHLRFVSIQRLGSRWAILSPAPAPTLGGSYFLYEQSVKWPREDWNRPWSDWTRPVEHGIISLSDVQLLTGIGILVAGYLQVPLDIDLLHWKVLFNLAWLSSVTQLASMVVLRSQPRSTFTKYRLLLMWLFLALLVSALWPASWQGPHIYDATPISCFYSSDWRSSDKNPATFEFAYFILSLVIMTSSYVNNLSYFLLGRTFKDVALRYVRNAAALLIGKALTAEEEGRGYLIIRTCFITVCYALINISNVLASRVFEIQWLFFALLWGSLRLLGTRVAGTIPDFIQEECVLGFGQALPLIVLALPLWNASALSHDFRTTRELFGESRQQPSSSDAHHQGAEYHFSDQEVLLSPSCYFGAHCIVLSYFWVTAIVLTFGAPASWLPFVDTKFNKDTYAKFTTFLVPLFMLFGTLTVPAALLAVYHGLCLEIRKIELTKSGSGRAHRILRVLTVGLGLVAHAVSMASDWIGHPHVSKACNFVLSFGVPFGVVVAYHLWIGYKCKERYLVV